MTAHFENSFNMTGSCTRCNESCCASSSCAGNAAAMNTALLLTMDTVIAVSIFAVLFAIIGIIGIVIISAAIIILRRYYTHTPFPVNTPEHGPGAADFIHVR